ncbi:hypothetical protein BGZ60DRAFT_535432 [Tricladium varicosporioides]|nr:hypothetical protein BGZ60DRAFT_535432 [Hymenoscyphus varicosporioides]
MSVTPTINIQASSDIYDDPAWNSRSNVLFHFYAYHYFAPASSALDLINLTDADVQFYDRTAHMILGMSHQYKLATYLESHHSSTKTNSAFTPPATPTREKSRKSAESSTEKSFGTPSVYSAITNRKTNGYRLEFLAHIQEYNINVEPRKRFYFLGLTASDTTFLNQLAASNSSFVNTKGECVKLRTASDGLPDSGATSCNDRNLEEEEQSMKERIEKCIREHRAKTYGRLLAIETDSIKEKINRMSLVLGGIE